MEKTTRNVGLTRNEGLTSGHIVMISLYIPLITHLLISNWNELER